MTIPLMPQLKPRPPSTDEERAYYAWSKRVYAAFAPFYDLVASPLRSVRGKVAAIAALDARSRVLDVATGTGSQARAFAEKAGEVVGIDLSEAMLHIARKKNRASNLTFCQGDAAELPFEDGRFDAASVSFALHEMPVSIRERVLKEMIRVTKPGGMLVVVDYGRPPGAVGGVFHLLVKLLEGDQYVNFMRSDLLGILRRAGIEMPTERRELFGAVRIVTGFRAADRPN
jgi:ubiquinone/menaquinone biosynthesis C-methylase UbiE